MSEQRKFLPKSYQASARLTTLSQVDYDRKMRSIGDCPDEISGIVVAGFHRECGKPKDINQESQDAIQ
jgi:hypothetical protein